MRLMLMVLGTVVCVSASAQQHSPSSYASLLQREIKALSSEQLADLREGRGMGASLPAELNGVPGPMHVLQLKDQLGVTPDQTEALRRVIDAMKTAASRLGSQIIDAERDLDLAFRTGSANEDQIRAASLRIGTLNAELRSVHLIAHLQTRRVLTDAQVGAYNDARGYSSSVTPDRHSHQH